MKGKWGKFSSSKGAKCIYGVELVELLEISG